jgi:hypothetical protein
MICTVGELHAMDLGVHMHVMEEWNEETNFGWQDAMVILAGYYTRVIQADNMGGVYVCTYVSGGEGDLVAMRVYSEAPQINRRGDVMIPRLQTIEHKIGCEMWWDTGKEDEEKKA